MIEPVTRGQAGGAAIAARLRRLSERMDREASALYAREGIAFEQRWFGPVALLAANDSLTVTEMSSALGISHAAVSQTRRGLVACGLVEEVPDPNDGRSRRLSLTPSGRALVARLTPFWRRLNAAAAALNVEAGDVSAALDRLEAALDARSLAERIEAPD